MHSPNIPPFYAQSVMRLSFFSHFDKRHLSHTSTNATSLFDSKRRYFAIAQYASLLRYWLCQYAPLGWAIAGRRYAQLARLCARRWWRLARIRRALPSVYCPVHNLAEKTTKPAQRAGFPNKKKRRNPPNGRVFSKKHYLIVAAEYFFATSLASSKT